MKKKSFHRSELQNLIASHKPHLSRTTDRLRHAISVTDCSSFSVRSSRTAGGSRSTGSSPTLHRRVTTGWRRCASSRKMRMTGGPP